MQSMSRRFARRIESFDCLHCGAHVEGDGYTNHCPRCLFSRHVDVHPGDREASCGGLMAPMEIKIRRGIPFILHRCTQCGFERPNRRASDDDFEAILRVSTLSP